MEGNAATKLVERLQRRLADGHVELHADVTRDALAEAYDGWIVHTDLQGPNGWIEPGPSLMVTSRPERLRVTILDPADYDCPNEQRLAAYFLQRAEGLPPSRAARVLA